MNNKSSLVGGIALALMCFVSATHGDPVTVGNFSFETPLSADAEGRFSQLTNIDVWEGESGGRWGFGFKDITPEDGAQVMSLSRDAGIFQSLNGLTVDGVSKSLVPLSNLQSGDQITLTIAVALRDAANIEWADSSYFALYDSSTFDLLDPINTALATTGFLAAPTARNIWEDEVLNYAVTGSESGELGIYIHGNHTGAITSSSGEAGHQAFFDNVRLDVPGGAIVLVPGDVDGDNDVDLDDFGFIRDNFLNTGVGRAGGDLNGDGVVNFFDFQEVVDNYPFPPPAGGFVALLEGVAVPEPTSVTLLCLSCLAAFAARRGRVS